MKKTTKKFLLSVFVVLMVFTCALLCGKNGVDVKSADVSIATTASAATQGYYTYEVSGGKATIVEIKSALSGKVTIPSKLGGYPVTGIAEAAFYGGDDITSIIIPETITSIGEAAFYYCDSLTAINVDKNNAYFSSDSYGVLFNKNKTELVQYPKGNTRTSYSIPNTVTSIGNSAFGSCKKLTGITIPKSVTNIGSGAFYACTGFKSITLPYSVTSIGSMAFYDCTGLKSITLSEAVISIGKEAFYNCTALTSITIPDSVASIGACAFSQCTSLKSITLPDSLAIISGGMFNGCTALKSITIPDSVESIGDSVFFDTAYYNNAANWENSVLYIGKHLITADANGVSGSYNIKEGTKIIADGAFHMCAELTNIKIPGSVTRIGENAFDSCPLLKSITIPGSVTSIGKDAFCDTAYFDNAKNWSEGVLYNGKYLIAANPDKISGGYSIKKGTTVVADGAFDSCPLLKSITIPASVVNIGHATFLFCDSIKSINLDANNTYYTLDSRGVLFNKNKTELIKYPCADKKTSYSIPDTVVSIGDGAFSSCSSFTSITIPASVVNIDDFAFESCSNIKNVYYAGTAEQWKNISFGYYSNISNAKIHYNYCDHTYKTTTTKATLSANGSIKNACTVCGDVKSNTVIKYPKTFTLSRTSYTFDGKVKAPTVTVKDTAGKVLKKGTDYTVTYSEGRTAPGTYKVTVRMMGNYSGTKTLTFKINPINISTCTVKLSATSYTYDGKVKAPTVSVVNSYGTKLTKGKHYTVTYAEGRKNAGTYKVTVKMIGNYSGTKTLTFKINPIKLSACTVKLSAKSFTYNGNVQTPTLTVKNSNSKALTKGTDYTVTLESGRKMPGRYTVTVTGKGNYSGTKNLTYTIAPKVTTKISATQTTSSVTLTWNKVTGATGYRVFQYNATKKEWVAVKTLTANTFKVTGLSSGTTYKFKVKAYKDDNGAIWGVSTATFTTATKPAAPKITSLTSTKAKATLKWSDVSGESGYEIYYSTKKDSGFTKLYTCKADALSYTKSNLTSGKTYYFKVRAYKTVGETKLYSAWSAVKSIKIK